MYIILDLEWNQLFPSQKGKQNAQGYILRNDIIQLGAVKMNAQKEIVDTFSTLVCPPGNGRLNPNITKVTGLKREMLTGSPSFPQAIEKFCQWCKEEDVFLTWGYDDIPILKQNLLFYGLPMGFCANWYNAQEFFAKQLKLDRLQYALKDAAQMLEIELDKPMHDALQDALYTTYICQRLNVEDGIRMAGSATEQFEETIYPTVFSERKEALRSAFAEKTLCPYCKKDLLNVKPYVHHNGHRYYAIGECAEHGHVLLTLRCMSNGKNVWQYGIKTSKAEEKDLLRYEKDWDRRQKFKQRMDKKTEYGDKKMENKADKSMNQTSSLPFSTQLNA